MSDKLLSRFLRYVRVNTQADENSTAFPSTPGQLVLLEMLKQELSELGAADVQMTKHGYVIASIPATTRKARVPTVAFLAHVDTAPDCSGKDVKPIVHRKYDGKSGVAVVMTLVEKLLQETKRKHGLIRVCFTPMRRSAGAWTNLICERSERMSLTPWTAVRRGKFAGKPFPAMRPKSSSMASPLIPWKREPKGW